MAKLKFGRTSERNLLDLDHGLALVLREALAWGVIDFSIIETLRVKARQNRLFDTKKSRVRWPDGKHNLKPGEKLVKAADAVPYINGKISWNRLHCCIMAGVILGAAAKLAIPIRWGGNWDMDLEPVTDQDFQDLVHFERV